MDDGGRTRRRGRLAGLLASREYVADLGDVPEATLAGFVGEAEADGNLGPRQQRQLLDDIVPRGCVGCVLHTPHDDEGV